MTIETTHQDYRITYSEDFDLWRCQDLELESKSLSALKAKIGKTLAEARRVDNVPAYELSGWAAHVEGVVTIIKWADKGKVWIIDAKKRRRAVALDQLAIATPDVEAALTLYREKEAAAKTAHDDARAAFAAIPRATFEALTAVPSEG